MNATRNVFRPAIPLAAAAIIAVACGAEEEEENNVGDPNLGEPEPGIAECIWDDIDVGWDEETPDGRVPEDLLADAEGDYEVEGTATYDDSDETFFIGLERRGDYAVFREENDQESGGCGDRLELPVTFEIANESETIDETFETRADGVAGSSLRVIYNLDPSDLQGTWEPEPPEDTDLLGVGVQATFSDGDVTGEVYMRLEKTEGGAVSQENDRVYFW